MRQLTVRQSAFVDEYVISGNAAAAARAAGYGERSAKVTACRMLTKANLKAAIATKKQESAALLELRREHVIQAIMLAIATAQEQSAPSVMIRGWSEVAKLCGFYDPSSLKTEQRQLNADGSKDLRHVPNAELLQMLSSEGDMRNSDGSAMTPAQIDQFYRTLGTDALTALMEGRAKLETKLVMLDDEL